MPGRGKTSTGSEKLLTKNLRITTGLIRSHRDWPRSRRGLRHPALMLVRVFMLVHALDEHTSPVTGSCRRNTG